jgi:hypothetical protein
MTSYLMPGDDSWQADKALMASLTPLISLLSIYVMRYLDADAGQGEPISVADERTLGEKVLALGTALQARADRRALLGSAPLCVEGETTTPLIPDGDSQLELS